LTFVEFLDRSIALRDQFHYVREADG